LQINKNGFINQSTNQLINKLDGESITSMVDCQPVCLSWKNGLTTMFECMTFTIPKVSQNLIISSLSPPEPKQQIW